MVPSTNSGELACASHAEYRTTRSESGMPWASEIRPSSRTVSVQRLVCRSKLMTKIGPIPDGRVSESPPNVRDRCLGRWDRACENSEWTIRDVEDNGFERFI